MNGSEQAALPSSACRAREVLDRVGDKWSVYVIALLGSGTRRFTEIKRDISFITQRMLTVTLRGLERDGLIIRTVYPTVPVRVEYSLTPLGESLLQMLQALLDWSIAHVDQIDFAQQRYDRAKGDAATSLTVEHRLDHLPLPELGVGQRPQDRHPGRGAHQIQPQPQKNRE